MQPMRMLDEDALHAHKRHRVVHQRMRPVRRRRVRAPAVRGAAREADLAEHGAHEGGGRGDEEARLANFGEFGDLGEGVLGG